MSNNDSDSPTSTPDEEISSTESVSQTTATGRRKKEAKGKVRLRGVLVSLAVLGLLVGAVSVATPTIKSFISGPPDFPGPGHGDVQIEIASGDTIAKIGNVLKAAGVVKSVDAFVAAANENPKSAHIQPGFFAMKLEMNSTEAISLLVAGDSKVVTRVTIPEGKRASWIIETLAKETKIPAKDFDKSLKKAEALGLPKVAKGNVEGFLFPATYEFSPTATSDDVLKAMFDKFNSVSASIELEAKAKNLNLSAYDIIKVASMVEVEAHPTDFAKVSRVVYNRLAAPMPLGFDSTIAYGLNRATDAGVEISAEELAVDTPYNSRMHAGLPPTPIGNPGEAAIIAALNPEDGPWLFFVTTDLVTQETKFTDSESEFNKFVLEYQASCEAHKDICYGN